MEVVTAGAQDELMQSLDYKLKTSNTSYVTARHDVQYFPSSLSSFSPTTSRVCRNKAMEGFDEVDDPRIARAVHQGGYADVLLRPTMVGILRCGKMLPPQLNLVIEIEFADATTALWSENAGAHPAGATLSTDFEIQNVRVLASQVVLDSALVESFNRVLLSGRSLVFSYPTVHTQQSSVPNGVAEHNVTVARAFTKLMGAFVTFWDNDAGSKIHLLANPGAGRGPHRRGEAGGQPPGVADAAGQPAVPTQPHEGSLGALPLPLRPRGYLRRHGAAWATCATASLPAFPPSACPRCR